MKNSNFCDCPQLTECLETMCLDDNGELTPLGEFAVCYLVVELAKFTFSMIKGALNGKK